MSKCITGTHKYLHVLNQPIIPKKLFLCHRRTPLRIGCLCIITSPCLSVSQSGLIPKKIYNACSKRIRLIRNSMSQSPYYHLRSPYYYSREERNRVNCHITFWNSSLKTFLKSGELVKLRSHAYSGYFLLYCSVKDSHNKAQLNVTIVTMLTSTM